jgi:putative transposase
MSTKFSSGRTRRVYEFIRTHRHQYNIRLMCRILEVTHSGYYAWLKAPHSRRSIEDARLLKLIRASFNASNAIYGSPRVLDSELPGGVAIRASGTFSTPQPGGHFVWPGLLG